MSAVSVESAKNIAMIVAIVFVVLSVVWTAFFMLWYLFGIPFGPG